jgi:hypothetical protein
MSDTSRVNITSIDLATLAQVESPSSAREDMEREDLNGLMTTPFFAGRCISVQFGITANSSRRDSNSNIKELRTWKLNKFIISKMLVFEPFIDDYLI